jgi:hypothetical protein
MSNVDRLSPGVVKWFELATLPLEESEAVPLNLL